MKCELIESDCMDDWYTIEKVSHDNKYCLVGDGLHYSGRVSDACVEGPSAHMLSIAYAINNGESVSFKRCAAHKVKDGYLLSSPRNSMEPGKISLGEAKDLAADIIRKLT